MTQNQAMNCHGLSDRIEQEKINPYLSHLSVIHNQLAETTYNKVRMYGITDYFMQNICMKTSTSTFSLFLMRLVYIDCHRYIFAFQLASFFIISTHACLCVSMCVIVFIAVCSSMVICVRVCKSICGKIV